MKVIGFLILAVAGLLLVFGQPSMGAMPKGKDLMDTKPQGYPVAYLAGGCFWCTESEYRALNGVLYTRVGYMGGELDNPTYRDITTGKSGHAEVVEVTYDPDKVSYRALLEFFLTKAHDPTQKDRQGVDVGTQYRSAIFYQDKAELAEAKAVMTYVDNMKAHKKKIVTSLEPAATFWLGEEYHQQYYEKYEEKTGAPHIRVLMKKRK